MRITDLLKVDSILLNEHNENKDEALNKLIDKHYECGHIGDKEAFKKAIIQRETLSTTGVGNMIAIPHAQDESVNYPSLVAMVDKDGVDFESLDGQKVKLLFMIAVPKTEETQHLDILAQLSQILLVDKKVNLLIHAQTPKHFLDILTENLDVENKHQTTNQVDIVAVTACPTGIAHTYMAAKALEDTATAMNVNIKVETNGASGIKNKLTQQDILEAKAVIIAADKKVDKERFKDKVVIEVPVATGIHEPEELIKRALHPEMESYESEKEYHHQNKFKLIRTFYQHMMNGVSNIIPFLMIYGVLNQAVTMLGLNQTNYDANGMTFIQFIMILISFLPTILRVLFAGFIAESISDKPGFVVASAATCVNIYSNNIFEIILIGFVAGYVVLGLKKLYSYIPKVLESIVPNILLPLSGILIMVFIISLIPRGESYYTSYMNSPAPIILDPIVLAVIGFVLGAMMSIDMGGPVNKTAYCIGIMSIFMERYDVMSAVMIGGMIPPIVIWLSMITSPKLFTEQEKKNKWNCLIKGLCFVSEEAIPYMKKDKIGIHIPCIVASGIAGLLSMYYGCSQMVPHGGIIMFPIITSPQLFFIALIASILIGMSLVLCLRKNNH